jgi:hypothetical protein
VADRLRKKFVRSSFIAMTTAKSREPNVFQRHWKMAVLTITRWKENGSATLSNFVQNTIRVRRCTLFMRSIVTLSSRIEFVGGRECDRSFLKAAEN